MEPLTLQKAVIAAVHSINKDQATTDIRTVDQIKDLSMANRRLQAVLLGVFASVALLLAGIGIYGVISYSVAQRTHEIGIRAALGADEARLMGLILRRGVILAVIGLVVGVTGSLGLTRLMESLLYGVQPGDMATFAGMLIVLTLVAAIAGYLPARRASRIDPMTALRSE